MPDSKTNLQKFISPQELADLLSIDVSTVYGWVSMKKVPYFKFAGKLVRFRADEIERWLQEKKVHCHKHFA